ncbi:hypothetical protein [Priestia megaterium]|uniref:hypothetical protein n=1 Tax=Priestia megaterium TaxID=1404 RepID=UPI0018CD9D54|nr:hypothetical protein [Priestia megaterium]MBG9471989.1 hypothetical protein [Priestia megaterium]
MEEEFQLRGKVIRLAREVQDTKCMELARLIEIDLDFLTKMEREVRTISKRNEIKILRGLRRIGVTDSQLLALTLIVNYSESEVIENGNTERLN